jgi:hypothetical protein
MTIRPRARPDGRCLALRCTHTLIDPGERIGGTKRQPWPTEPILTLALVVDLSPP